MNKVIQKYSFEKFIKICIEDLEVTQRSYMKFLNRCPGFQKFNKQEGGFLKELREVIHNTI